MNIRLKKMDQPYAVDADSNISEDDHIHEVLHFTPVCISRWMIGNWSVTETGFGCCYC